MIMVMYIYKFIRYVQLVDRDRSNSKHSFFHEQQLTVLVASKCSVFSHILPVFFFSQTALTTFMLTDDLLHLPELVSLPLLTDFPLYACGMLEQSINLGRNLPLYFRKM